MEPLLTARGIVKRYGRVTALDQSDFDLYPGEILAVIGDNGAGKSSLIKVISGAVRPDEGEIRLEGQAVNFSNPMQARAAGIETVYQNLALSPALSIADNMFLGREIRRAGPLGSIFRMLDRPRMEKIARDKLTELGLMTIQNINQAVETLSGGQRQGVAVARAAAFGSKVIILDEPTAALTPEETNHLFELMKSLQKRGVAMIFISHALEEALTHADRITVLRNGQIMATGPATGFDRSRLIHDMIGEELLERKHTASTSRAPLSARPILRVENIRMGNMVNNMSFSIFPGEITGIAGLIGSGRSEVAKVIMGHTKRNFGGGRIWLDGRQVRYSLPSQAVADGIAYVSEDRKLDGFFDTLSVSDNIGLGWLAKFGRGTFLAPLGRMRSLAREWRDRLSIRSLGMDQKVLYLSGGNQQKVVIAKSLAQAPKLVIFDEPTRGVDVGAIVEIHQIIRDLAEKGAGVMLISSYLPEILELSDRILVAKSGTIAAEFSRSDATAAKILQAAIH